MVANDDLALEGCFEVAVGGNAFGTTAVAIGATEFIGVAVAVLVLVLTFGSRWKVEMAKYVKELS